MHDAPSLPDSEDSILEKAQLKQLHDEAAAVASEPDLYERVRELTARALSNAANALS